MTKAAHPPTLPPKNSAAGGTPIPHCPAVPGVSQEPQTHERLIPTALKAQQHEGPQCPSKRQEPLLVPGLSQPHRTGDTEYQESARRLSGSPQGLEALSGGTGLVLGCILGLHRNYYGIFKGGRRRGGTTVV